MDVIKKTIMQKIAEGESFTIKSLVVDVLGAAMADGMTLEELLVEAREIEPEIRETVAEFRDKIAKRFCRGVDGNYFVYLPIEDIDSSIDPSKRMAPYRALTVFESAFLAKITSQKSCVSVSTPIVPTPIVPTPIVPTPTSCREQNKKQSCNKKQCQQNPVTTATTNAVVYDATICAKDVIRIPASLVRDAGLSRGDSLQAEIIGDKLHLRRTNSQKIQRGSYVVDKSCNVAIPIKRILPGQYNFVGITKVNNFTADFFVISKV